MTPRVWSPRTRAATVLGATLLLLALISATTWLLNLTESTDGAGLANVLALPATVLGTAATVYGLRTRRRADDPEVLLARARTTLAKVIATEERTLQRLLGDTGAPRPADLNYRQPELVRWRSDGGPDHGTLVTIAPFYRSLKLGRLVVLGEAGAGKTVLILQLLLDLARQPADRPTIPLRLSLSSLPAAPEKASPETLREHLDTWLAQHLTTGHGVEPSVAKILVADGWVLPILDGLDELDPEQGEPIRAQQVITALNLAVGRWPVILTCRTTRHAELDPLQDATAITVQPLDVEQIIAWLAHRFPDPTQPDRLYRRWRRVATQLRNAPTGRLARCLANPLRLFLAVTIYRHPTTSPAELCTLTAVELDEHLFTSLIPAVVADNPGPGDRYYTEAEVSRWLHTLAGHLTRMGQQGFSAFDLNLHELWHTTGEPAHPGRRIRRQAAVLASLLAFVPAFGGSYWLMTGIGSVLLPLVVVLMACVVFVSSAMPEAVRPQGLDHRVLRTRAGRGRLLVCLLGGLVLGGLLGALVGSRSSTASGWFVGIVFAFAMTGVLTVSFGLNVGLQAERLSGDLPRQGFTRDLVIMLASSLTWGFTLGVVEKETGRVPEHPLWEVFLSGCGIGLGIGVCLAFGTLRSPLPRYFLTVRKLARTGDLPRRPAQFLDWAYQAGLFRLSGTATQFRHRELQARLSKP